MFFVNPADICSRKKRWAVDWKICQTDPFEQRVTSTGGRICWYRLHTIIVILPLPVPVGRTWMVTNPRPKLNVF